MSRPYTEVLSSEETYIIPEGMPLSVFVDRYARKSLDRPDSYQTYAERMEEVVDGNFSVVYGLNIADFPANEYTETMRLAKKGVMPFSGRHIQHGDMSQRDKTMEVFTNCSTACFSFMGFLLLLNGSGVGRDYSSDSCLVDWDYMPNIRLVLNGGDDDSGSVERGAHPNFAEAMQEFQGLFDTKREAMHKYGSESESVRWIEVADSREGWAKVVAILETAAFHKNHGDSLFIFDFSKVRERGTPISKMQGRPAQGPLPLMRALAKVTTIKGAGMKPWKQALFIDHYLAACVVMGNVRRAARMSTKSCYDSDVIEFIDIKRGGHLWTSNNSVTVDAKFWEEASHPRPSHSRRVFEAAIASAYFDQTGEPGFINVDLLNENRKGMDKITSDTYLAAVADLELHPKTYEMVDNVLRKISKKAHPFLTNPCGEIVLSMYGGYCVIGDICLSKVTDLSEALSAAKLMAEFLVRVNTMEALYSAEVKRTNRIGVAITGIHEFAWTHFGLDFNDLISTHDALMGGAERFVTDRDQRAYAFWSFIRQMGEVAETAADDISVRLGMVPPHTKLTIKPSGTISKIMGCTEGAHLPTTPYYVRWVVVPKGSEREQEYRDLGYPIKDVSHQYTDCCVVGFPTRHPITEIMPDELVVTADQVSPDDHFKWLRLLEKFWLGGPGNNNQISYTINYNPELVDFHDFMDVILRNQPTVRCCSVMPIMDTSAYSYTPIEQITREQYEDYMLTVRQSQHEAYSDDELQCVSGVCPI